MERASDIIALIPKVKPRVAMRVLKEAVFDGQHGYEGLSHDERNIALDDGWVLRISPVGGRILLELFEVGLIPQNGKFETEDLDALRQYAAGENDYREEVRLAAEKKAEYEKRISEIASNPDCAVPSEITTNLIDKVFLERFGYGHFGELKIAGLSCHKCKTSDQLSNSGKTRYPGAVYCYWYDAEGKRHGDTPIDIPKNRRNDPVRNWGLGRE